MRQFIFVALAFVAASASDPKKPIWPVEFDAPFGLNIPADPVALPNGIVNGSSHFYYNWDQAKASLIVYENGCLPGIFPGSEKTPCNFTFVEAGTFFTSADVPSCLWFPGVGSVPPNFLAAFNYSGFDQIVVDLYSAAHFVHFWNGPAGFQYWTEDITGLDIALVDGGSIQWAFGTLTAGPQDVSLFNVPSTYSNCPWDSNLAVADPFVKLSHALSRR
eukprot:TRINITY_DN2115_c0_g1_i1.p2 TRINITY_DN2115_c0_g1~~TRINITY_DN2115_c0_g1_i1.p2  ORF type:complete len:218 (+),score=70.72 TRINITY_DN2115_c0_g1_i1:115-768(+)